MVKLPKSHKASTSSEPSAMAAGAPDAPPSAYQDRIMTHSRAPRFHGPLAGARTRTGLNPLCGDEVVIYLAGDRQAISSRFESKGCALCKASASILMAEVQGQPATAALQSTLAFVRTFEHGPWSSSLSEDLQALADLRRFASRTKCVLLPWQTLAELLQEDQ